MKIGALILPCLLVLLGNALSAQEGADKPITESWREVLRYGIDSEVLEVVKKIQDWGERSLNRELVDLFQLTVNPGVKKAVLEFFVQEGIEDAEEPVLSALKDEENDDPDLLVPLIEYLSAIKSNRAEPALQRRINTDNERVAAAAIRALGVLGGEVSGEKLLEKLRDVAYPDSLKPDLILSVGRLKYAPAADDLIAILNNRDENKVWRMYAAYALGEIGEQKAVAALRNLFLEQDSLLKAYAAAALARFSMSEVEEILQQGLKDSNVRVRLASAQALANKNAQKSVDILIYKIKNDPDKQVRVQAIKSLGEIGTVKSFEFLREVYRDDRVGLLYREAALGVLCDQDLSASLGVIRTVIDAQWSQKDQKALEFTARKLAGVQSRGLAELYKRFLDHPGVFIRLYGLRGIKKNRTSELKDRVRILSTEDPQPSVRKEALAVLEMI